MRAVTFYSASFHKQKCAMSDEKASTGSVQNKDGEMEVCCSTSETDPALSHSSDPVLTSPAATSSIQTLYLKFKVSV